ncbi:uncharacterized protein ACA1_076400 [Acanthamoeba castellanii str. Neff]|uniref:Uncharacterized protein n=1 Tax=Acanthamoeba castellanii (strain ATCC 30010 / Neff) TaxID=1257118 RepID=L8GL82_ACACF|nr:uncharacterized protein ACA1_076400 [Acanthamoeba castellanii str. Neff]ELR13787.1 hypothetical protein ACA1_076400 [Acanthamoeba castellanii str. Neff]
MQMIDESVELKRCTKCSGALSKSSGTRSARRSSPCRPTCHAPVDHIGDPLVLYELLQSCVATKGTYEEKIEQNAIPRGVQQAQRVARR